jgi:glycosyltransferase involved in cell wall biosynthesis
LKLPKHIAVNTRFLLEGKLEGIGRFTEESLRRLVLDHPDVRFTFLFDRPFSQRFLFAANVSGVVLNPPARHPLLWFIWFECSVAGWLSKNKPDVFLSTDGFGILNTKVPQLVVFHDLAFEHYPDQIPYLASAYYRYFTPRYARKANAIAAVSDATAKDICQTYGVSREKIYLSCNAAAAEFKVIAENEKQRMREAIAGGSPYFIFIGALHPRKNIEGLLRAYEVFRKETALPHKLLLAGRWAWKSEKIRSLWLSSPFHEDIIVSGHTETKELAAWLAASEALVYPSFFEGFGIPLLEAMQSGVPVITSNVSSMPEVAGEAALLCEPDNYISIFNSMKLIASDTAMRSRLIQAGLERVKNYSWERASIALWEGLQAAINRQ